MRPTEVPLSPCVQSHGSTAHGCLHVAAWAGQNVELLRAPAAGAAWCTAGQTVVNFAYTGSQTSWTVPSGVRPRYAGQHDCSAACHALASLEKKNSYWRVGHRQWR